jgi:hypothetical protein
MLLTVGVTRCRAAQKRCWPTPRPPPHRHPAGQLQARRCRTWPVARPRHGYQQVGSVVHGLAVLAHHVVEAQVQLVQGQLLLRLAGSLARGVLPGGREGGRCKQRARSASSGPGELPAVRATATPRMCTDHHRLWAEERSLTGHTIPPARANCLTAPA